MHAFFLGLILAVKWYAYTRIRTTVCILLVSHTEQVLTRYLMINQLIATADCCQLVALEGSVPWPIIIHLSEQ